MKVAIAQLVAALSMLSATAAGMAAGQAPSADSRVTREQVRAEFLRARAAGEVYLIETRYPFIPQAAPDVKRELALQAKPEAKRSPTPAAADLNKAPQPGTGLAAQ